MATRFVAIAGDASAVSALAQARADEDGAQELRLHWHQPGLALFATPGLDLLTLPGRRGFVIGRLFLQNGSRIRDAWPDLAEKAVETGGRSLISNCWGSYGAFLGSEAPGAWSVVRDPSGGVPVYYRREGPLRLYASDLQSLFSFGRGCPQADKAFVLHWLAYPYLRTARTGLSDVSELLPGFRDSADAGDMGQDQLWSPWSFAAATLLDDFDAAAERLRHVLLQVIPAATAHCRNMLLELSGGLDSSIVAAALSRAGSPFEAVNFVTASPDGDERRYARLLAETLAIVMIELLEEEKRTDLAVPQPAFRPGLSPLVMPLHRAMDRLASARGIDAFVTGAGGDNVFCYLTTAAPIVDAARDRGWGAALLQTAPEVAALNDCTWWTATRLSIAKAARGRKRPLWKPDLTFLSPDAVPALDPHPWLAAPPAAAVGKREHVESLLRAQHFLDSGIRSCGVESIHPLMAQPVLELCLRIPTWLWTRGGRNRAVARAAMRDIVPRQILARSTKGRLEGMCAREFSRSRGAVAELLLGGRLDSQGWLDRPALESCLSQKGEPAGIGYFRVMELAASELWLRSWDDAPRGAASARHRAY